MAEAGKRPFWMHQLVEYILGGALVASGLQSPYPVLPSVLGGIIMMNAAMTKGALAAFNVLNRRIHRLIDPVIILLVVLSAVRPWAKVDDGTRVIILGIERYFPSAQELREIKRGPARFEKEKVRNYIAPVSPTTVFNPGMQLLPTPRASASRDRS